jgi:hypothetical protein
VIRDYFGEDLVPTRAAPPPRTDATEHGDGRALGYSAGRRLWNVLKRIAAGASVAEEQALFTGTARRVYWLG